MHQCRDPRLSRYSKTGKELLVDYLNALNNKDLSPDQLLFGTPVELGETGLTQVSVRFAANTGWSDDVGVLTYNREDINVSLSGLPIVVHVTDDEPATLVAAIQEQYGIKLEKDHFTLELKGTYLVDAANNAELPGLDAPHEDIDYPLPVVDYFPLNRNYLLTFKDHLVFVGEVAVYTRRSLTLLGKSINARMDLRKFYADGNFNKPHVDLLIPNGQYSLTDEVLGHQGRRAYESTLYEMTPSTIIDEHSPLPELLRKLSGDPWVCTPAENVDFNLHGARVMYNGFVSKDFQVNDPAFNFVLAIELSDDCANLSGIVKLAYRYSDLKTPGNLQYDQSHIKPVFSR